MDGWCCIRFGQINIFSRMSTVSLDHEAVVALHLNTLKRLGPYWVWLFMPLDNCTFVLFLGEVIAKQLKWPMGQVDPDRANTRCRRLIWFIRIVSIKKRTKLVRRWWPIQKQVEQFLMKFLYWDKECTCRSQMRNELMNSALANLMTCFPIPHSSITGQNPTSELSET